MGRSNALDWRGWVTDLPETAFPLTVDGLLLWLRCHDRVPLLFWDQFRTCLLSHLAGTAWMTRAEMLRDLERVRWE